MNRERLVQSAKEFGRIVFLALPSFLVGLAIQYFTDNPELSTGVGGFVLLLLKSYDRGIHEDPNTSRQGIAPF